MQVDRGGRYRRMPQVVTHSGQLRTACQGVRRVRVAHPVRAGAPWPLGRRRAVDLDHLGNFQEKRRRMLHSLAVVMLAVLSGSMLRIPVKSTCHSVLS